MTIEENIQKLTDLITENIGFAITNKETATKILEDRYTEEMQLLDVVGFEYDPKLGLYNSLVLFSSLKSFQICSE